MTMPRKKLIEVSIPLEAINKASAREKSIRHGHPSTLHLWWARRPLAACRAVVFAQLVDDPSSWPERFPTEETQEAERRRLHKVIEDMVPWEASNDETILNAARFEIARSVAWGLGEEPPAKGDGKAILDYLQTKAPPVYDPFSGGGSIPLEAQRLGLRAYGSDLNPVAVLIGKALVEIPPKFAGLPPVNPKSQAELKRGGRWNSKGAEGLAEDVRYYGQWMRDEAERRIGHLYPNATLEDGSDATVIAWLWARTVRSPDPAAKGAKVPLVTSFMLSTKDGKKTWVEPVIDASAADGWRFHVKSGKLTKADEDEKKKGTKTGRGTNFACVLTGSSISPDYTREEGLAGRLGKRLMAIVAEGDRSRVYLSPSHEHEAIAAEARPGDTSAIEVEMPENPRWFSPPGYGMTRYVDLFTSRQLVALTTFSDLAYEAREKALADARAAGVGQRPSSSDVPRDGAPLHSGGMGAGAYADAIATYLGLIVGRCTDAWSSITSWASTGEFIRNTFARQALPMVWDFSECNPFSASTGNFNNGIEWTCLALTRASAASPGEIHQITAQNNNYPVSPVLISTDPPYYDNIGYADLSDFFYVWHRRTLSNVWPDLYRRLTVPKEAELVATPYRHGGKAQAEAFFMNGMGEALTAMRNAAADGEPLAIYYAFKQAEAAEDGTTSAGWASFLQAVVDSGLAVDGTWPIRTERQARTIGVGTNALASSIVLVCRKRSPAATVATRSEFIRALKREMPDAIAKIRAAGVGPVDMQQAVIGPGMGVFTRFVEVLEDDDSAMTVKTSLSVINRVWEEIDNEIVASFDPETQVALTWFGSYGFDARASGELIGLATAKDTATNGLYASGVFKDLKGKSALMPREELPENWSPSSDRTLTIWECVQHVARTLNDPAGGAQAAARLIAEMGPKAADARALLDRLFKIATDKGWAPEALVYNQLAEEWPHLLDRSANISGELRQATTGDLFG
ncbi:DUF1156 domain-containing protein [Mesorhizobium sp. M2E.F.Ca.ET.166.01.1.1]|nr:DUF1156 domain-containing protein [Mesorhizobium sp. M2E.F.Ca.ET.219.01.1.1]TGT78053.1 DUF1156 domain-containing protein [Mesorhizobium sp. M2E.F.Ca.ET.166.01.1.1]TGW04170.1 DUF1156 domain-containing protein [Mesorhizobium sp. M2E.F.Ca.ET.154.01.1.1]